MRRCGAPTLVHHVAWERMQGWCEPRRFTGLWSVLTSGRRGVGVIVLGWYGEQRRYQDMRRTRTTVQVRTCIWTVLSSWVSG